VDVVNKEIEEEKQDEKQEESGNGGGNTRERKKKTAEYTPRTTMNSQRVRNSLLAQSEKGNYFNRTRI
jgi:hypothetical protein